MSEATNTTVLGPEDPNGTLVQPVGVFAQFCLDLQTAAKDAFIYAKIDPTHVYVGHYEFCKEQEFYKQVACHGFEMFIGPTQAKASAFDKNGDFHCLGELIYTVPADESVSLIPIMKMKSILYTAFSAYYLPRVSGGNRTPLTIEDGEIDYKSYVKPFVLTTTFTFTGNFIVDQANAPYLNPTIAVQP